MFLAIFRQSQQSMRALLDSLNRLYESNFFLDNLISFGQVDALDDFDRIRQTAERGGVSSIIEKMPQQYETVLGRRWERGQELSGGEWQKVASFFDGADGGSDCSAGGGQNSGAGQSR